MLYLAANSALSASQTDVADLGYATIVSSTYRHSITVPCSVFLTYMHGSAVVGTYPSDLTKASTSLFHTCGACFSPYSAFLSFHTNIAKCLTFVVSLSLVAPGGGMTYTSSDRVAFRKAVS